MSATFSCMLLAGALSVSSVSTAKDLDKQPYALTRAEWLEYVTFRNVIEVVTTWRHHVGVRVRYASSENTLIVVVTSKNGSEPVDAAVRARYEETIAAVVRGSVLESYSWARDVKIVVQFV